MRNALAAQATGKLAEARAYCQRSIAAAPASVDAWHILAVVELQAGRGTAARLAVDRALELAPGLDALYITRARIHEALANWEAALADCAKALELAPDNADAWLRQARVYRQSGKATDAVRCFDRYLSFRPEAASVWFNRGNALNEVGNLSAAIDSYAEATRLQPDFVDAWFNRGSALLGSGRSVEAIPVFEHLLSLWPDHGDALINLGNAWRNEGRDDLAANAYLRALAIDPKRGETHNNLASIRQAEGDIDGALAHFDAAILAVPNQVLFYLGKATALKQAGRLDAALDAFDKAVAVAPDYVEAHTSRSLCRLLAGYLPEGFEEYEWRWQSPDLADIRPDFSQTLWLGKEDLRGKRLLVRWEQGLGDTIQFSRYVVLLNALGAEVILQVQKPLLALLQGLSGEGMLIADGQPVPDFDYYVPMLSLPLACRTTLNTMPSVNRYLRVPSVKSQQWQSRVGEHRGLRIGLAWSGRPEHKNDKQRSLSLAQFVEALPKGPAYFVLQKDVREADVALLASRSDLIQLAGEFGDFSDTAAVCEMMDLVISVDTSIAHLAGALGRPLWLLLPFVPDWRWLMEREDTPWYPSATLFRQAEDKDWQPVMLRVRAALSNKLDALAAG